MSDKILKPIMRAIIEAVELYARELASKGIKLAADPNYEYLTQTLANLFVYMYLIAHQNNDSDAAAKWVRENLKGV